MYSPGGILSSLLVPSSISIVCIIFPSLSIISNLGMIVEIIDKETGEKIYEYETDENPKIIEGIPIGDYEIISKDPDNRGYVTEKKDLKVEDTEEEQQAKMGLFFLGNSIISLVRLF